MPRFALSRLLALLLLLPIAQVTLAQAPTSGTSQPPVRDPQSLAVMQQSVTNMGGSAPTDSTATGTITTVAGSRTESGTVTILTRGTDQTAEAVQTPNGGTLVYSQGQASNGASLSGQQAMTSQSPCFPLPLLVGALNNPDTSYQYIGLETVNGASAHHIQFWNSFASNANAQYLSEFTTRDIWIDANSYLPLRMSYVQRAGGGSAPRIAIDIFYSNFQSFSGVLYPLSLQRSFNGTPSATITLQQVVFNTGLSNSNFPVQQEAQ